MGPGLASSCFTGLLGDGALTSMTGLIKATPGVLPLAIGMLLVGRGITGSARVRPGASPSMASRFGDCAVALVGLHVVASRAGTSVGFCRHEAVEEH